jgi:phenylalanyl-tRNA synthetase alpha chain
VYRNEATDYKHLAEFYQVEGIVVWENASFVNLQGCLKEFYKQLGFNKIKFVPHYFPYTEPSMEIHVYHEQRKEWIELGGSGIFRPEVSIPLWGKYPVLAWGLGIERLPLLKYDIKDIRTFYQNDLKWLRETKTD